MSDVFTHKPRLDAIERQRGALWNLGLVVVASLCATLLLVTWSSLESGIELASLAERWPSLVGLAGLVMLFALYATRKQRELSRMHERFQQMALSEASLRARLGELSLLFDTGTQLQLRLDMQSMLELAAQRLLSCFEAHQSSVMMHNPETGMLEVRAVSGVDANLVAGSVAKPGVGIAGTVFTTGESQLLGDAEMRARFPGDIKPGRNIASSLVVPMRFRGDCVGVLSVSRTRPSEPFTDMHRQMLESFAEHCAATFVKTHHHQTLLEGVRRSA
jgi:transcriptional regulator with GAF, ATPase, and Fis domain